MHEQTLFDDHLEFMTVWSLLSNHFESDVGQVLLWLMTPNPLTGNISPKSLINCGDLQKVKKVICNMLAGNTP